MRPLIGTSWKMNLTATEAAAWLRAARPHLEPLTAGRDLFVLPPFPALTVARDSLGGSGLGWGGQDIHPEDSGAHTGDVSGPMLADLGCTYAEIGHSERRRDHGETHAIVAAKVRAALRWDLTPIVCIGERERGPTGIARSIVEAELVGAFPGLEPDSLDRLVVAYEPVWAIGEGNAAADPDHVTALHGVIDAWLGSRGATRRRVIYGGSVDEGTAAVILGLPNVSGLFVGRAALDPLRFAAIAATPVADPSPKSFPVERSA